MTKQEIEKLERICKENGFVITKHKLVPKTYQDNNFGFDQSFVIEPEKDEWEGVEFAECVEIEKDYAGRYDPKMELNKIYLLKGKDKETISLKHVGPMCVYPKEWFKPSTEQAYKDQLIAEANKRFGEIKHGDLLFNLYQNEFIEKIYFPEVGFSYEYDDDLLCFGNIPIYQKGKWTKRVPDELRYESFSLEDLINFGYFVRKNPNTVMRQNYINWKNEKESNN